MSKNNVATVAVVLNPSTVVINRGARHGVTLGAKYVVFGVGEVVKDPETGKALEALEVVRGHAVVSHLQDSLATLKSTERKDDKPAPFEGPSVGDKARAG